MNGTGSLCQRLSGLSVPGVRTLIMKDDHRRRWAIVHRPISIAEHYSSDTRRALRQAIGSLGDDPAQLEVHLKLSEKVIFDDDGQIEKNETQLRRRAGQKGDAEPDSKALDSLAIDATGRRPARRPWLQCLAYLAPSCANDSHAIDMTRASVGDTPRRSKDGEAWLLRHLAFLKDVGAIVDDPMGYKRLDRPPQPGDLVYLASKFAPRVRIVVDVHEGKRGYVVTVVVAD